MRNNGFTLIEMLIAVAVLSILTLTAVFLYFSKVRESRRSDALTTLASISLSQERWRSTHTTYGTLAQVWTGTTTPNGYYNLAMSNVSGTAYTITATAVGDQTNDSDSGTACSSLVMTISSGTVTKTPSACWPQ